MTIKQKYLEEIESIIFDSLKKLGIDNPVINLENTPSSNLGDVCLPIFKYASILKRKPFDIADDIKINITNSKSVDKVDIKGGYINIFLNKNMVAKTIISEILKSKENFGKNNEKNIKVIIEFSCPNTNKPLHLGHCRNNVIGDCISRLLKFTGYSVKKVNLINDRGVHICKSMLAYKKFGNSMTPKEENRKSDHFVGDFYVKYSTLLAENISAESDVKEMLLLWENNDKDTMDLWKKMNKWAIDGIMQTYSRMGIAFDDFEYESINYIFGKEIIDKGIASGVFYKESDGSIWVNNEDVGLDKKAVLRRDGTSIYITQDLATAVKRQEKFGFDRLIYVVGSEQVYHFKTLFAILNKLGYKWSKDCFHLSYGMVYLPDGKMKSREGNVVDADDIMDLLYKMASDVINEKQTELDENDKSEIANKISLAALKYYLLNFSTSKDITFNPSISISFDGNTGPYLLYTIARINSLLNKEQDINNIKIYVSQDDYYFNGDEWSIITQLLEFEWSAQKAANDLSPVDLCNYLYELSRIYNKFYHDNQILNQDQVTKNMRLSISNATLIVLRIGLNLLGIEVLEKM